MRTPTKEEIRLYRERWRGKHDLIAALIKLLKDFPVVVETPVAWGDYWAGPNHTLPTAGHARFRGPLSVYDFLVPYSVIKADVRTARASGDKVKALAELEGLAGHTLSIALREENDD